MPGWNNKARRSYRFPLFFFFDVVVALVYHLTARSKDSLTHSHANDLLFILLIYILYSDLRINQSINPTIICLLFFQSSFF